MKPANPRILTINGGSSNIKFALFEAGDSLGRILQGLISANASRVAVRIIHTDEEWMIAKTVCRVERGESLCESSGAGSHVVLPSHNLQMLLN